MSATEATGLTGCHAHSLDGFIQQARDFNENYTDTLNVIVKNLTIRSAEFPWLVDRAAKLLDWYEHGNYNQIVNS